MRPAAGLSASDFPKENNLAPGVAMAGNPIAEQNPDRAASSPIGGGLPQPNNATMSQPYRHRSLHRLSGEFRAHAANGSSGGANGNGPLPVPTVSQGRGAGNGHVRGHGGPGAFEGARSPPSNKNTSHVPCKFYRQGACQAGKACPFLHSDGPMAETAPCKYFAKGNCKFGAKCALAHILPDGRRVNRPNMGVNGSHFNLGGRVSVTHNAEDAVNSSLLTMQAHMAPLPPPTFAYPPLVDDLLSVPPHPQKSPFDTIPTIDTTFTSHAGSNYGSPPNDGRLAVSPAQKGLSLLDAPLPASFDSQGISLMARYGPIAASVPSKFGFESPPSSLPVKTGAGGPSGLRHLHDSSFGEDVTVGRLNGLGSSPPVAPGETLGKRMMHSERFSKSKMMSASLGAQAMGIGGGDDWDGNFAFEEDLVPRSLHDLLTPQEKIRRLSHTDEDLLMGGHRQSLSGLGTPADSSSKVGSPVTSSPSRFVGALFPRAHSKGEDAAGSTLAPGASPFGHVGSPLRNSSLHPGASPSLRPISKPTPGDVSPFVSSPPRQGNMGMSMISQQLRGMRVSSRGDSAESASSLHPNMARVASGSSAASSSPARLDRAVSSGSISRERIDEEQGLFSMEEEEQQQQSPGGERERKKEGLPANGKRYSWGMGLGGGSSRGSPSLKPQGGQRGGAAVTPPATAAAAGGGVDKA